MISKVIIVRLKNIYIYYKYHSDFHIFYVFHVHFKDFYLNVCFSDCNFLCLSSNFFEFSLVS